jgi:hypothetical protein
VIVWVILAAAAIAGSFTLGWFLCSRTQSNRIDAALALTKTASGASQSVLDAAHKLADIGKHLSVHSESINNIGDTMKRVTETLDQVDRSLGSILNVMVNSGLIGGLGGTAAREPQTGERPLTRARSRVDDIPVPPPREVPADGAR